MNLSPKKLSAEVFFAQTFHSPSSAHLPLLKVLHAKDYLEAKYPTPAMLPSDAKDLAIVGMVELATNELLPATLPLSPVMLGLSAGDPEKNEQPLQKISIVLKFFESLLDERPFFGSENITLAEPLAGTVLPWLSRGGVFLSDYPKLNAWCDRIQARPSWQATEATPEIMEAFKSSPMIARMAAAQNS